MKNYYAWSVYMVAGMLASISTRGALPPRPVQPDQPTVTALGPHHRVWEIPQVGDRTNLRPARIVEMETGMNRWNAERNQWEPSVSEIKPTPEGALATFGQYTVAFGPNLNVIEAVKITLPDGTQLNGGVLALAYRHVDQYVIFANLQDCVGEIVGTDVIYRNVFQEVAADVRYSMNKSSFQQFLHIKERVPPPTDFGLPANSVLELITELRTPKAPQSTPELLQPQVAPNNQTVGQPGIVDETLDFFSMLMPNGAAFAIGVEGGDKKTRVAKNWVPLNGRYLLVEQVPWEAVAAAINALPPRPNQAGVKVDKQGAVVAKARVAPQSPKARVQRAENQSLRMAAASREAVTPGFLWDYSLVTATTNVVFTSGTTFYISGPVTLYGTTVFEGNTVLKYAPTNTPMLFLYGPVSCLTGPYRPAVLTARDDSSVGEYIYNSGPLSSRYASEALAINAALGGSATLHDFRIAYADVALDFAEGQSNVVNNFQFVNCGVAVRSTSAQYRLRNALVYGVSNAFWGDGTLASPSTTGHLEHVTFDQVQYFTKSNDAKLVLTNCLVANVTNAPDPGTYTGLSNAVVSGADIFQTIGGGAHYLADAYRNYGTTNIDPSLAADLKKRTTFGPMVISPEGLYYTQSVTLVPWVPRDTAVPCLGYHYDVIDYAIGATAFTNVIQVEAGVVIAGFNPSNVTYYAMALGPAGALNLNGQADAKITVTHYCTVQEVATSSWAGAMYSLFLDHVGVSQLKCRFADFTAMSRGTRVLYTYTSEPYETWNFIDCEFHTGTIENWSGPGVIFTNCLFNRVYSSIVNENGNTSGNTNRFHNCTVNGGIWETYWETNAVVSFANTLFAGTDIQSYSDVTNSRIGYTTNCVKRLSPTNTTDVVVTSLTFQSGSLGNFYLPTNSAFMDAGTTNADLLGFWHYTTSTNNMKETNSLIQIGFHYVATDANGKPLDYDGDGMADYYENWHGSGVVTSGETDWQNASDWGLRVVITRPRSGSPLP